MKAEELKNSTIFQVLKQDKKAQEAAKKLGSKQEWLTIRQFVAKLKQTLLEAMLEVDDLADIQRYKHVIRGMESVALLPQLVDLIAEVRELEKVEEEERKREAERKKYAPGTFARNVVNKLKKK